MRAVTSSVSQKDRVAEFFLLGVSVFLWLLPRLPVCPSLAVGKPIRPAGIGSSLVRSGLEERLLLSGGEKELVVAEAPGNLGSLEPKGRTNPDGSEVWGFPEGSGLEEMIEVHVKGGRVVREVLRPSSQG